MNMTWYDWPIRGFNPWFFIINTVAAFYDVGVRRSKSVVIRRAHA